MDVGDYLWGVDGQVTKYNQKAAVMGTIKEQEDVGRGGDWTFSQVAVLSDGGPWSQQRCRQVKPVEVRIRFCMVIALTIGAPIMPLDYELERKIQGHVLMTMAVGIVDR